MARMKKVKVNGKEYWQLDNRKRLFTEKEILNAEKRYDKTRKKRKARRK